MRKQRKHHCRHACVAFILTSLLVYGQGCKKSSPNQGPQPSVQVVEVAPEVPKAPTGTPVRAERAAYYKQALPEATAFFQKPIPSGMVMPLDRGNDSYVEGRDAKGTIVGYVRDITAPVTSDDACACNPLNVSLVFGAKGEFRTLLSPAPLQKYGHQELTAAEHEKMISILRNPPEALVNVRTTKAVVDASSGATRKDLAALVVPQAGLSTHRLVHLVLATQRILQGAPASRDRDRLSKVLEGAKSASARAKVFAIFLPTAESDELRLQIYRAMGNDYAEALRQGSQPEKLIEDLIIDPPMQGGPMAQVMAQVCYRFADAALRPQLVRRCLDKIVKTHRGSVAEAEIERLKGTLAFVEGDIKGALDPLQAAARAISSGADPALHLRYAQVLTATGKFGEACAAGKALYLEHPLLPDVETPLQGCRHIGEPVGKVIEELQAKQREHLLNQRLSSTVPAPTLAVDDLKMQPVDLNLGEPGKVTVLVIFATWCPHCRKELPRIVEFAKEVQADKNLRNKVRIVGLRTAVERETQPFDAFEAEFDLNFPVWVDSTMSMAFARFARTYAIQTSLPTLAVLGPGGAVQFFIEHGDYSDTVAKLRWATEALLQSG